MGTPALICVGKNKKVENAILVFMDGNFATTGAKLLKYWNTSERINELMNHGGLLNSIQKYPYVNAIPVKGHNIIKEDDVRNPSKNSSKVYEEIHIGKSIDAVYDKESYVYYWDGEKWWGASYWDDVDLTPLDSLVASKALKMAGYNAPAPRKRAAPTKKRSPLPSQKNCPVKVDIRRMF